MALMDVSLCDIIGKIKPFHIIEITEGLFGFDSRQKRKKLLFLFFRNNDFLEMHVLSNKESTFFLARIFTSTYLLLRNNLGLLKLFKRLWQRIIVKP